MMKNKYLPIICLFFLFASCSGMNDIIQDYLDRGEINYIGRPDSLLTTGGNGRMQLRWLAGKDPRVEGYIIYWNNRTDSVVGEIDRNNLLKDRYNFCIFNVKESSYEFELVQTGSKGVNSIAATVTGNVYGDSYISQLKIRELINVAEDVDGVKLTWGISNSSKYVDFTYEKADGTEAICRISSQVNDIILPNPKSRGAYSYSTYYVPGKDSLDVFKAPEVVDGNFPF